jgi:hypothetical protein
MSANRQAGRAIEACRRAGLPVVDQHDCTCRLRGQLAVLVQAGGLEVVWPYDGRCPIHQPSPPGGLTPATEPALRAVAIERRARRVSATEREASVTQSNGPTDAAQRQDASRLAASYHVELVDLGPEPEWHQDRRLYAPWQRYELVARNPEGDELARARGSGGAECWYRIAGELRQTMGWAK